MSPVLPRRPALAVIALVLFGLTLLLAGCSSEEEAPPAEATPATDLPDATDLATQDDVVPAGQWGIVQVTDAYEKNVLTPVAMKVTNVLRGDAGELSDVTSVTGGNELLQTGTPWYITVQWAVVTPEGKSTDSPITNVWGWSTDTDTGAMQLNLPPSQLGCAEAPTEGFAGTGMAHTACAAAMFEDSSVSLDQVRFVNNKAYPEGDHAIKFEIPAS